MCRCTRAQVIHFFAFIVPFVFYANGTGHSTGWSFGAPASSLEDEEEQDTTLFTLPHKSAPARQSVTLVSRRAGVCKFDALINGDRCLKLGLGCENPPLLGLPLLFIMHMRSANGDQDSRRRARQPAGQWQSKFSSHTRNLTNSQSHYMEGERLSSGGREGGSERAHCSLTHVHLRMSVCCALAFLPAPRQPKLIQLVQAPANPLES